jgi:hypothetical protein
VEGIRVLREAAVHVPVDVVVPYLIVRIRCVDIVLRVGVEERRPRVREAALHVELRLRSIVAIEVEDTVLGDEEERGRRLVMPSPP